MATFIQSRQPFAALDGSRLQALGSMKNRQNAITVHDDSASSQFKPTGPIKSNKRALSPDTFADFDSENIDPNIILSPSKKAKGSNGAPVKSSKFNLITTPATTSSSVNRQTLSLSVPTTSKITPISQSRGSPKHKRVGLLSKGRRASSSPHRRSRPSTSQGGVAVPFSIDAALSGTISSYKPVAPVTEDSAPASKDSKSMPKSWFFEIHEDTPEEEAANLMEHSASVLDISSDDDGETKLRKLEEELGKENVPPPDFVGNVAGRRAATSAVHKGVHSKVKAAQKAEKAARNELMQEDRTALASLERQDFFPDGLDEKSVEVITEQKASAPLKCSIVESGVPSAAKDVAESDNSEDIYVCPDLVGVEATA